MNTPLPVDFIERLRRDYPLRAPQIISSLNEESTVSIRWNPKKVAALPDLDPVPWSKTGFYLNTRPTFAADPWWHAGVYYVQEPSSMLLEKAIEYIAPNLPSGANALDLSAAPGGKTLLLDQCLDPSIFIVSNEIVPKRAQILRENVLRWGSMRTWVTNNAPTDFTQQAEAFDLILVDAPCSGEGMFRKDPNARSEWTPESGAMCAARQTNILNDIWPALAPGGYLIYSTCTFDPLENLDAWARLEAEVIDIPLKDEWGVERIDKNDRFGYQCFSDQVRGEGFFFTVLRKPGSASSISLLQDYFAEPMGFPWVWTGFTKIDGTDENRLYVTREERGKSFLSWFRTEPGALHVDRLKVIYDGPVVAELKGKEWRPTTEAVWSDAFTGLLPQVDLNLNQALDYLHGNDIRQELTAPGMVVLRYRDVPIGVGKQVRGRINNGYPKTYRLRKHPSTLERSKPPW